MRQESGPNPNPRRRSGHGEPDALDWDHEFKQELDRLFDRFGEPTGQESSALGHGVPSLDVSDTKEAFVVMFSMPGMDANDIQLSLQENVLTIKDERKQEKEDTGGVTASSEAAVRLPAALGSLGPWTRAG